MIVLVELHLSCNWLVWRPSFDRSCLVHTRSLVSSTRCPLGLDVYINTEDDIDIDEDRVRFAA